MVPLRALLLAASLAAPAAATRLVVDCDQQQAGASDAAAAPSSFPTLAAARDELRRARAEAAGAADAQHAAATIEVRGRCAEGPLELSGPLDSSVRWVGAPGAAHSGGLQLPASELAPVSDPAALALLPSGAHAHVQQLNLSALGLNASAVGKLGPHHYPGGDAQINFFLFEPTGAAEVFWANGAALHRARYPNSDDDQLLIPQNSMLVTSVHHGDGGAEINSVGDSLPEDGRGVPVQGSAQLARWAAELASGRDVWAHGEWSALGWADVHKPVVAVNASALTVSTTYAPPDPHNSEGRSGSGGWFRVYNLLSELDAPGEYVIAELGGSLLLLVYPPAEAAIPSALGEGGPTLSMSVGPVLHVHDAHDVSFSGIDIEYGRGWGAVFDDCEGCAITDCRVRLPV